MWENVGLVCRSSGFGTERHRRHWCQHSRPHEGSPRGRGKQLREQWHLTPCPHGLGGRQGLSLPAPVSPGLPAPTKTRLEGEQLASSAIWNLRQPRGQKRCCCGLALADLLCWGRVWVLMALSRSFYLVSRASPASPHCSSLTFTWRMRYHGEPTLMRCHDSSPPFIQVSRSNLTPSRRPRNHSPRPPVAWGSSRLGGSRPFLG